MLYLTVVIFVHTHYFFVLFKKKMSVIFVSILHSMKCLFNFDACSSKFSKDLSASTVSI